MTRLNLPPLVLDEFVDMDALVFAQGERRQIAKALREYGATFLDDPAAFFYTPLLDALADEIDPDVTP